jgi:hypothetical protein
MESGGALISAKRNVLPFIQGQANKGHDFAFSRNSVPPF